MTFFISEYLGHPAEPISLRTLAVLLKGLVAIHEQQVLYLLGLPEPLITSIFTNYSLSGRQSPGCQMLLTRATHSS